MASNICNYSRKNVLHYRLFARFGINTHTHIHTHTYTHIYTRIHTHMHTHTHTHSHTLTHTHIYIYTHMLNFLTPLNEYHTNF